jgi:hypothetical protein
MHPKVQPQAIPSIPPRPATNAPVKQHETEVEGITMDSVMGVVVRST